MNKGILVMGALGFLAGAVVAGGFTFGVMNGQAAEAEAHAHAAEDRAQTCEAQFQKQTVIYESPSTTPAMGVEILAGLLHLPAGALITSVGGDPMQPRFVIPAAVRPQSVDGTGEYSWVDPKTHAIEGPWRIQ